MSTLESIFSQNLCTCGHSILEEHENGKCYSLEFDGAIWKACDCRTIKIMPFNITVKRDANNLSQKDHSRIEERKTSSTEATEAIFQWGKNAA